MKLYTPTELAKFVACHDLGNASEREIIEALKAWDKQVEGAEPLSVGSLPTERHGRHPSLDAQRRVRLDL